MPPGSTPDVNYTGKAVLTIVLLLSSSLCICIGQVGEIANLTNEGEKL